MRHNASPPRQRILRATWIDDRHVGGPCGGADAADHRWCKRGLRLVCEGYHCGHEGCDAE